MTHSASGTGVRVEGSKDWRSSNPLELEVGRTEVESVVEPRGSETDWSGGPALSRSPDTGVGR